MGPILISSLPKQIIELILGDPERYNFNNKSLFDREYLDKDEIAVLLQDFGKTDVSELYTIGMDTFKSETKETATETNKPEPTTNEEQPAEVEETEEEPETTVDSEIEDTKKVVKQLNLMERDSAENELKSMDATEIALNGDSPLSSVYQSTSTSDSSLKYFIESVAGEISKVEDNEHEDKMTEESTIKYTDLNGNEKELSVHQSIQLGGIVKKEKVPDSDPNDGVDDSGTANDLDGGIHYTAIFKNDSGFNMKFKADVDNTDQDFYTAISNHKQLEGGGEFNLTGTGRLTLEQDKLTAGGGFATDYKNGDLSAGALGYINYESNTLANTLNYDTRAFVSYKDVGSIRGGIMGTKSILMPYAEGKIYGNTTFDSGLTMAGSLSARAAYMKMDAGDGNAVEMYDFNATARGSLSFQANDDFKAKVDAMLSYENVNLIGTGEKPSQDIGAILRGSFIKGKTEVYTIGCIYKDLDDENPLVTGAATFGIQINDFIKKGLAAYIEGTICNTKANLNPDSSINGIKVGSRLNF